MNEQYINEANRLIAHFMGYSNITKSNQEPIERPKLEFQSSWDLLMPVWHQLKTAIFEDFESNDRYLFTPVLSKINQAIFDEDIEAMFIAIDEGIILHYRLMNN